MTTLIWFRDDLRVADHPALAAAATGEGGVVALYVLDEVSADVRPLGGATKWWLHHSLASLERSLLELGIPLLLIRGAAATVVPEVAAALGAGRVLWNRRYGAERNIDAGLKQSLREQGFAAHSFMGGVLFEPGSVRTGTGGDYRVYSAFWRACLAQPAPAEPLPTPDPLSTAQRSAAEGAVRGLAEAGLASAALTDWALLPTSPNWAGGIAARWMPGEAAAHAKLEQFLTGPASVYQARRDFPAEAVGSELAPHLRFGEVSPRQVWHTAVAASAAHGVDTGFFLSEVGWREFAWHTLFHNPDMHTRGLNARFDHFPWRPPSEASGTDDVTAWQRGETGFPLVDAGMRELWETGFMHNRVRMVVASFLTKNLLIDWRVGEAWFWDTLVDADAASNPFVFNPVTQQQKFDPEGTYVERYALDSLLRPEIVDLRASRVRALAAYDSVRFAAPSVP